MDLKPLTGAHMSAAGGLVRALERGREIGCAAIQVFTKNPNRWAAPPLADAEAEAFKAVRESAMPGPVVAHDSYLINLASFDDVVYRKSMAAFEEEVRRAESLGIDYLVMHPGAHRGAGEGKGLRRVAESLNRLHDRTPGFGVKVLLETTAGQGTNLGFRFEHLSEIIEQTEAKDRLGACFDTCHAFAAGYDIRTPEGVACVLGAFDRAVGLHRLMVFHVNDSKRELRSRTDRHAHIGKGEIGMEAFRALMNDGRFRCIPKILETPEMETMHRVNLKVLNGLAK